MHPLVEIRQVLHPKWNLFNPSKQLSLKSFLVLKKIWTYLQQFLNSHSHTITFGLIHRLSTYFVTFLIPITNKESISHFGASKLIVNSLNGMGTLVMKCQLRAPVLMEMTVYQTPT